MESKMMGDSRNHAHGASVKVLTDLMARLEAAGGPDRELDFRIWCALFPGQRTLLDPGSVHPKREAVWGTLADVPVDGWEDYRGAADHAGAEPLTASLDAAFGLVERVLPGTLWELYRIKAGGFMANLPDVDSGFGPTPALALLTALVRALISNADSAGPQDEAVKP